MLSTLTHSLHSEITQLIPSIGGLSEERHESM
jgi:hypothetical protein